MITVLSGGTGSIKTIRGLSRVADQEITIIGNVGDNIWLNGLYICPDLDTVAYGLAGLLDEGRGWGVREDTFNLLGQLEKYGSETWFQLGDKDLATHLYRTNLLKSGLSLSQVTANICRRLGLKCNIIPASDVHIETQIVTDGSRMHLQEFWVKRRGQDSVRDVIYQGANDAKPAPGVIDALLNAERIVICPANPITSIGPILAVPQIRNSLMEAHCSVIALSPMIGEAPISGPAGRLMSCLGLEVSAVGVTKLYSKFLDTMIIDNQDANLKYRIEEMGIHACTAEILMKDYADEDRIARLLLFSEE